MIREEEVQENLEESGEVEESPEIAPDDKKAWASIVVASA